METLSESFKTMKDAFGSKQEDEEEETFFTEVRKKVNLTWKQRLIAFGICFIVSCLFAVLGVIFVRIEVAVFAVFFCLGTIAGVVSTFFLVSPIKQVKEMLSVVKVICVIVFLIAFVLTLCAAFWWTNVAELAVLFGIIQFIALGVYCVMLIPYAQHFIKAGCGKLVSAVTSS